MPCHYPGSGKEGQYCISAMHLNLLKNLYNPEIRKGFPRVACKHTFIHNFNNSIMETFNHFGISKDIKTHLSYQ